MSQVSEATMYRRLETLGHRHFCSDRSCRRTFRCLDVPYLKRCESRAARTCAQCRGGAPEVHDHHGFRACCVENVMHLTDRDQLLSYRLAGPGPWYRCKTCFRCGGWPRGFNPNLNNNKE